MEIISLKVKDITYYFDMNKYNIRITKTYLFL